MQATGTILQLWETALPNFIDLYNTEELIDLYRVFDIARVFPSDESLDLIDNKIGKTLNQIPLSHVSQLHHSLANTGRHLNDNFFSKLTLHIEKNTSNMQVNDLANALFFLMVNALIKDNKKPTALMHEIRGRLEGCPDIDDGRKRRIIQFSQCFGLFCAHEIPRAPDNGSPLERSVRDLFNSVGYMITPQPEELKNHGSYVDFPLKHGMHRFLTEVDGPTHFMHQYKDGLFKPMYVDGQTIIKTAVHTKLCPEDHVLRLPLATCKYLLSYTGREATPEILPQLFNGISNAPYGAYFVDLDYSEDSTKPNLIALDFFKLIRS